MMTFCPQLPIKYGTEKRLFTLRVCHISVPPEPCQIHPSPIAHRLDERRVAVADKVRKWRGFAIFLAHEQQWNTWGEQNGSRGELQLLKRNELCQSVACTAIPHLIVILRKHDKALGRNLSRGIALTSLPIVRILPLVHKP